MNQIEAVRLAMLEVGNVSSEELVEYIAKRFGVTVKPQYVPILKATLKDKENLAEWRRKSQAATLESSPGSDAQPQVA
jgi:hypothetical protein